jgi:hypothetical protein
VQHLELVHFIKACLAVPVRALQCEIEASESDNSETGAQTVVASGSGEARSLSQTMVGGGKQEVRVSDKAKIVGVAQKKT